MNNRTIILLAMILLLGAWLRFYRLGDLPIDGDNAYHVLGASAINEHGVPLMPSGKLYTRAVPLIYLQTLSARFFSDMEFAIRFPNALIGVLNILLVFVFCKALTRKNGVAVIAAFLFAVSPVAIYFSRMPRMYETFLFTVLAMWTFFFLGYFRSAKGCLPGLIFFSVLSITLHEAAILPLICYLTPIVIDSRLSIKMIVSISCFFILFGFWAMYPQILYMFLRSYS